RARVRQVGHPRPRAGGSARADARVLVHHRRSDGRLQPRVRALGESMAAPDFELTIGDRRVRVELLDHRAPRICQAFRASLPVDRFAVPAKFAGDGLIVMVPFVAADENPATSVAPGDIGYYPSRQTLCLFYGQIMPFASVTVFARVLPDDLPSARAA